MATGHVAGRGDSGGEDGDAEDLPSRECRSEGIETGEGEEARNIA